MSGGRQHGPLLPPIGRRTLLAGLGAAGAGLAAGLPIQAAAAEPAFPKALRIGLQKIGSLVLLRQQGTLERVLAPHGVAVSWVEFSSGPPILEALNAGAIDFAYSGDAPPIFGQAAGASFVYVAFQPVSGANEGLLVHRDGPLHDIPGLRGRTVGVTRGSSAHNFLVQLLGKAGLKPTDVQVSFLQPPDAAAAFRQGSLDAWAIWDPYFAVAQADPGTRLLSTGEGVAATNNFFLAGRSYAERNPALMRLLVGQINDTAQWAGTHKGELAQVMAQVTGVSVAAQTVAAARGSYTAAFLTDAVVAQQQEIADTFAGLRLVPGHVAVRDAVWTPPPPV